jgi:ferredoxin
MALVDDTARVDEEQCTGCGACADVCPVGAIRPVLRGEIVPSSRQPPATYRPGPLVETAGAAATVAGMGLLMRVARALARVVGRWLARRSELERPYEAASSSVEQRPGAGRRRRRRRRGG